VAEVRAEVEKKITAMTGTQTTFPADKYPLWHMGNPLAEELVIGDAAQTAPHFNEIGHMDTLWIKTYKDENEWVPWVGLCTFLVMLHGPPWFL
jgi:hypothetical protein